MAGSGSLATENPITQGFRITLGDLLDDLQRTGNVSRILVPAKMSSAPGMVIRPLASGKAMQIEQHFQSVLFGQCDRAIQMLGARHKRLFFHEQPISKGNAHGVDSPAPKPSKVGFGDERLAMAGKMPLRTRPSDWQRVYSSMASAPSNNAGDIHFSRSSQLPRFTPRRVLWLRVFIRCSAEIRFTAHRFWRHSPVSRDAERSGVGGLPHLGPLRSASRLTKFSRRLC